MDKISVSFFGKDEYILNTFCYLSPYMLWYDSSEIQLWKRKSLWLILMDEE